MITKNMYNCKKKQKKKINDRYSIDLGVYEVHETNSKTFFACGKPFKT